MAQHRHPAKQQRADNPQAPRQQRKIAQKIDPADPVILHCKSPFAD
jgi:hypothetical protein